MKNAKSNDINEANFRKRAEEVMQAHPADYQDLSTVSVEEVYRIIHELRVHQIELEMQNEELRKTQLELEAARNRYSDLYDFAPVGYITVSEKGLILEANFTSAIMLGVGKSLMIGEPFTRFITSDTQDVYYFHHRKLFETKIKQICELKLKKKDGTQFYAQLECILDEDAEGKTPPQTRTVVTDVSRRRQIEKEKKNLEAQIRQSSKMEAIGTLTGGIAHDFNNLLMIILGNTELALDDTPEWNPVKYNLEEIRMASLRAKDVVQQLLSFARKTTLEKKPTNVIPTIKETLKWVRSSIPTSIDIHQNMTKDVHTILADPTQINQVLMNLCTNANHAMPDGGIIEVTLKNVELSENAIAQYPDLNPGRYVNLTISDTGHGIPKEVIDRIFDPYFTTKEVGKGTGMGLAVIHGIVKGHNGIIKVKSEIGKGATFNIFFPAVEREAVIETETDEKLPTGDESILFIDDEESIMKMGSQRLERLGYKVESTTSPIEALEVFRSNPGRFDLVITDLTMPKMTGDKLVEEILNIRPDISIILCTGFSEKIDAKKAKEIGAANYIEKPIDKRELAKMVRNVLDGNKV